MFSPSEAHAATLPTTPAAITNHIKQESTRQGIDPNLMVAMAKTESSLNPSAQAGSTSASGLFQMTKAAAKQVGMPWDKRFDPIINTKYALKYYKWMEKAVGSDDRNTIIAGYYAGPGNVRKAKRWAKQTGKNWLDSPDMMKFKPSAREHIAKVLKNYKE